MTDPTSGPVDEERRRAFESALAKGQRLQIEECLPAQDSPLFRGTLLELVHIDLEFAWKRAGAGPPDTTPPRIEDYLRRFPQLDRPWIVLGLVEQEYLLRQRHGGPLPAGETEAYRRRLQKLIAATNQVRSQAQHMRPQDR